MVQQMIQNDPNVPPMLRQSINQLASNPAMINQLSQMLRDPGARSQIEAMARNHANGGVGAVGGEIANSQQGQLGHSSNPVPATDQDQTEEEMIAEAIRRSLEEG